MEQIKNLRILQGTIPATEWNNANNIVLICTALTNLELPLVDDFQFSSAIQDIE